MDSRVLGDYQIVKQIGQGALGSVFLAEHRFMKKQYMLKVLPEELAADRSFAQRFQQEVSLLSNLEHPHIVKMHNVSYAQGVYFLVSDCVVDEMGETTNLAQYLLARGQHLKEEQILHILRQVADALDYAHSKKASDRVLVHRGLKLNNIIVGKSKPDLHVSLCDFGLAAIVGEAAMLTRTYRVVAENLGIAGPLFGAERFPSPALETNKQYSLQQSFLQGYSFLAPEQKRLERDKLLDARIDTYAFGVLAYFLLMRQWPEGRFTMPSEGGVVLRKNWDLLIDRCLQADPRKRPDSLMKTLELVEGGEDVAIAAPSESIPVWEREASFVERDAPESTIELPVLAIEEPRIIIEEREYAFAAPAPHFQESEHQVEKNSPSSSLNIAPVQSGAAPSSGSLQPILMGSTLQRPVVDLDPAAALHVESGVKHYQPQKGAHQEVRPLLTEMKVIRGGEFVRGSNDGNRDETPRHKVSLSTFAVDIHPVTNEQFVRFLEVMGGEKDHQHQDLIRLKDSRIKRTGGRLSIESGYAKHPVVGVTWYGAVGYARWIGKRLPTEAEWEVAARGGLEELLYTTGEDIEKSQANFFSSDTTAVMSYAPNGFGLFDVAGNVYEWCQDWYGYNYYEVSVQEPDNPKGPVQGVYRVIRGGCWKSLKEDLRCSRRHRNNPGTVNSTYGFRCAADVAH